MSSTSIISVDQQVTDVVSEVDQDEWSRQYWEQSEFLALERLMPQSLIK